MTQEQIQKQAEKAVIPYVMAQGSHDTPEITARDYTNGFTDGANYILSSTESVEEKPKWTVRVSITLSHGKRDMTFDFDEFPSKETIEAEVHEFCRIHHVGQRNGYSISFGEPILLSENRLPTLKRSSGQAGCAVWVDCSDRKPEEGKEVFFDGGEHGCLFGKYVRTGNVDYVVYKDMDGDDHYEKYEMYERWLDESLTQSEQGKEAKMKEALEAIANPIKYLQDQANKEGSTLNGIMAIQLSKDANWLQSIATEALKP